LRVIGRRSQRYTRLRFGALEINATRGADTGPPTGQEDVHQAIAGL
jgi:hypothetical protein